MAKRKRRRKKNPSTAQWVALGIGGVVGLGLLGYGVKLMLDGRKTGNGELPEGATSGGVQWQYTVHRVATQAGPRPWRAIVYEPGGLNPTTIGGFRTEEGADSMAQAYIIARGGTPVYRDQGQVLTEVIFAQT